MVSDSGLLFWATLYINDLPTVTQNTGMYLGLCADDAKNYSIPYLVQTILIVCKK